MTPGPVLASLLLFLCCPLEVRGLTCYSCHYNSSQTSCAQFSPEPAWRLSCPASSQTCLVTRGRFQSVSLLTRECGGPASLTQGCRTRELGGGAEATICSCSTELCNLHTDGAGRTSTNIIVLVTILYLIVSETL